MGAPLAAVVALAAAAAAVSASASASVSVRTNRAILIPDTDASAELLVVARDVSPGAKLELTATAGQVTNVRPLGDGRYQATFVPPQDAPPAVAFVTATVTSGERTELGYTAIAIHGAATVEADVAPGARVMIDVGGRAFGPFTADAQGRVRAPLLVPPRLERVTLQVGSEERAVPLELPPISLLHAAIPGDAGHGRGEEPLVVELVMVDRTGYPGWKPAPRLAADRGEVAPLGPKSPGVFRWSFQAPEGAGGGVAKLTASIPGDPASVATLEVKLRPPRSPPKRANPGAGLAIGLMVGGQSNLARAAGGTPSVELAVRLPSVPVEVMLRADRAFYGNVVSPLGATGAQQVATFGGWGGELGARATWWAVPWLGVHVAGSVAGRLVETTVRISGGPADGATETSAAFDLGAGAAAGLSVRAGPGRFLAEVDSLWMPGRGALRGNLGGWGGRVGFLVELL